MYKALQVTAVMGALFIGVLGFSSPANKTAEGKKIHRYCEDQCGERGVRDIHIDTFRQEWRCICNVPD